MEKYPICSTSFITIISVNLCKEAACKMMPYKYILYSFLLLVSFFSTRAQTKTIENLKRNISLTNTDERKLQAILLLCDQGYSLHPDTLMVYAQRAFDLAAALKNKDMEVTAMYHESGALTNKGLLDSALHIANTCQEKSCKKN